MPKKLFILNLSVLINVVATSQALEETIYGFMVSDNYENLDKSCD